MRARYGEGRVSSSSDEAKAADTETNLTSGGRRRISHGRRKSQGRVNKGINGTVSEAVSSVKPPRRMKRKASVMWSRSSSGGNGEAEGTERCKFKKREKGRGP